VTDVMILKNIFAKKSATKIGGFDSKESYIMKKFDNNIGFREKRFSPKMVENRRQL
jgi:hypothetical protein